MDKAQRMVVVNFPDEFEFPKEYDINICGDPDDNNSCPFADGDCANVWCALANAKNKWTCPFYGKGADEVVEI